MTDALVGDIPDLELGPAQGRPQHSAMIVERAGNLFGALWLIVWFLFCLFGILCTMAAQDFQKRLVGATDNTRYSVGYALDQVDELSRRRLYWADRTTALHKAQATEGRENAAFHLALSNAAGKRRDVATLLLRLQSMAPGLPALPDIGEGQTIQDLDGSEKAAHAALAQISTALRGGHVADAESWIQNTTDELNEFGLALRAAKDNYSAWDVAKQNVQTRTIETKDAQTFINAPPFDNHDFEQLTDDLTRYQGLFAGVPYRFVGVPGIALTLILTVLMGILGSLIAMTRALVFENAEISIGEYLFRIGLGASVALAVFFFAGVGVLTLAQSSAADHGVEPSPYLVSFFAIIAGYLSRRVTLWMRESGGRTFPVREEADRWAIDLKAALDGAQVTAPDLVRATGLAADKIELWIARKEPIPIFAQGLIAAFVRKPAYTLFSDVSPPP